MKRKIYADLLTWKGQKGTTAFFIDGPRRVGKSYIAQEFAKNEYKSYVLIDFYLASDEIKNVFIEYRNNLDLLFRNLSILLGVKLYERQTVFIFDEIQFFPEVRGLIKYLVADGRFDYIETGSLVSIKKNVQNIQIPSEEHHVFLYPLDFEEFLWALDEGETFDYIKECFTNHQPLGQAIHRKIMELFRTYLIVGGMPQAILAYLSNTASFDQVDVVKREILELYRNDIRKYADRYALKVEALFDSIPSQLSKHEKKFKLTSIDKNARFRNYEEAIFWLSDAGIINPAYNSTEPSIGLGLNEERSTFKAYMFDTGLLISHAFPLHSPQINEVYKKIILNKLELNEGMIIENVAAQMLRASGHKLYFYSTSSKSSAERMEIDFLIPKGEITSRHNICPIEIKSGKRYRFTSLEKFKAKFDSYLSQSYIIHMDDLKIDGDITYLPIYMLPLL